MSPSDQKRAANAAGGKTARACDSCMRKRARWYCAADDAFLCQACDSSVHSANSLARRHERVRLKTASFKPTDHHINHQKPNSMENSRAPAWHQGFRRKARTPRHAKPPMMANKLTPKVEQLSMNPLPVAALVPEIGNDEASLHEENEEEQLLYRVPIFDPFVAELCKSETPSEAAAASATGIINNNDSSRNNNINAENMGIESKDSIVLAEQGSDLENLHGLILPSDMELAEFAADVETLLGRGLDEDSFRMEGLGLLDANDQGGVSDGYDRFGGTAGRSVVKIEEENDDEEEDETVLIKGGSTVACAWHLDQELEMSRSETLDLNFDCDTPTTGGEEDLVAGGVTTTKKIMMKKKKKKKMIKMSSDQEETMKRRISLRLDYDAVIAAWASQGSPWTTGDRPELNPDDCWIESFGTWATDLHQAYGGGGEMGCVGAQMGIDDGGREARVSRYREKRRTRLFSKKIRYEVRKLNAEKRPRMKGRFVKRASFVGVGPSFPF